MRLRNTLFILFVVLFAACTVFDTDSQLEDALEMAGDNRTELEKVLEHYEGDSLKLEAAKFLIRNMPGHYSYADTSVIVKYSNAVDSILKAMKDSSFNSIRDSINSSARHFNIANLKKIQDIKIMSAQYLIKNIDNSFKSWQKDLWAQHLSFEDFCEYILPYKVGELQLLDDWRIRMKNFHSKNLKELEWCDVYRNSTLEASRMLSRNYGDYMRPNYEGAIQFPIMKWETNAKVPFGTCDYYAPISMALFRSNGIPVGYDFTPHWAGRRLGHSWNVLIAENGHSYTFNGICSSPGDGHNLAEKMAKVYRHTYAINKELVELNKSEKYIPKLFKTFFIKDVTSDYMGTIDVDVEADEIEKEKKFAFLAIFGDQDWCPIAFGKIFKGMVHFKNLGRNTLYMPYIYDNNGKIRSIDSPFVVLPNGKIRKIVVSKQKKINLNLKRKYPTLEFSYHWLNRLDSCEFQASNYKDFSNYQIIHRINDCHGIGYNVKVLDSIPAYRYWRFYSTKPETHANIAELYFFDSLGKEIKGKAIGTDGSWADRVDCTRDAAFDGDILSFFDAPDGDGSWVGADFGKPVKISHFFYYARGDGNAIEPKDNYELFYWNYSKWNSLGIKKAFSPTLIYRKIPSEGVYLLRNLTKGQEERIFTYENGKQIWW